MPTKKPISIFYLLFSILLIYPTILCHPLLAAPELTVPPKTLISKISEVFSGYYKMLTTFSKSTDTKEAIFGALQRLRLEFKPKLTKNLQLDVVYDHELFLNDFSHTTDFNLIRQNNQRSFSWFDADRVISDTDHVYEKHLLHRAFLKFESPHTRVTFGKQLIDWGRMRFYSPLDIFNPPLPSSIEADERPGFDALNIELTSDNFSSLNVIYGPAQREDESSYGLKLYKKIKTYDTFLITAKRENRKIIGAGFDGYIMDAGFRGEFSYTKDGKEKYPRAGVGVDYNFPHQIYTLLEYFYNGAANNDLSAFSTSLTEARKRLSVKKNLISFMISHKLTPLLKISLNSIYDVSGKSAFLNPEIRYNISENLDVACGSQLFVERKNSEFQNYNNVYYIEAKLFF